MAYVGTFAKKKKKPSSSKSVPYSFLSRHIINVLNHDIQEVIQLCLGDRVAYLTAFYYALESGHLCSADRRGIL